MTRKNKGRFCVGLSLLVIGQLVFALAPAPSFARGGHWSPPPKEYRDPNLWYGDACVPDDIKGQIYSNYKPAVQAFYGTGQGAAQGTTPAPTTGPALQTFSGPAHIEPTDYHYFVQTYSWTKN